VALPHRVAGMTITCATRDLRPASTASTPVNRVCGPAYQHIRRVPSGLSGHNHDSSHGLSWDNNEAPSGVSVNP
jgi:hypothetical protein